jgi:hypothetical protein
MNRRAYFFIIDSIVALTVLTIGVLLIYSFHENEPRTEQPYAIANDVANILSYHKIKSINNDYAGPGGVLVRDLNITDLDKTLLEQVAEFYYRNKTKNCSFCLGLITSFLNNITINLVPSNYNYIIMIQNETIYLHNMTDINSSIFIIPSRKIVHGVYNSTEFFGPYLVEVLSWG